MVTSGQSEHQLPQNLVKKVKASIYSAFEDFKDTKQMQDEFSLYKDFN